MTPRLKHMLVVIGLLALVVVPGAAFASEHDEDAEEDEPQHFAAEVDAYFDELLRILVFGINTPDVAEPLDCAVPDGVVIERSDDPDADDTDIVVVEGEWEIPEGCEVVDVTGPNGQVNHGQVVSGFVHALKALDRSTFDVPFGQLVRQIAASDFGKMKAADDADDDSADDGSSDDALEDGDDEADDDPKGPPPHANNDKDKKPKGGNGNNGNGWGPPNK